MSDPSSILATLKTAVPLTLYVRGELDRRRAGGAVPLTTDLVREILTSADASVTAKIPGDAPSQEALYKAVATQIRIAEEIGGKDVISKDGLNQLLADPFVAEAIQEAGLKADEITAMLENTFDMLPILAGYAESALAAMFLPFPITTDEVGKLKKKEIPISLLPKLSSAVASKNSIVLDVLRDTGISVELFELLPLLMSRTSGSGPVPKPQRTEQQQPNPTEVLRALGVEVEEEKPASPAKTKGWASGYGTWIVGGGSAVLGLIGFFVEDNVIKSLLIALGAFGVGGSVIGSFETPRKIFGSAN